MTRLLRRRTQKENSEGEHRREHRRRTRKENLRANTHQGGASFRAGSSPGRVVLYQDGQSTIERTQDTPCPLRLVGEQQPGRTRDDERRGHAEEIWEEMTTPEQSSTTAREETRDRKYTLYSYALEIHIYLTKMLCYVSVNTGLRFEGHGL